MPQSSTSFPALLDTLSGVWSAVNDSPYIVGRGYNAHLILDDSACADRHFHIVRDGPYYFLEILEDVGAIYCDGRNVRDRSLLRHQTVIRVGTRTLIFFLKDPQADGSPSNPDLVDSKAQATVLGADMLSSISDLQSPVALPESMVIRIGRDPQQATFVIKHPQVSRLHARLTRTGATLHVRDTGSANGTFVNGRRIDSEVALHPKDRLTIGPVTLRFDGKQLLPASRQNNLELVCRKLRCEVPGPIAEGWAGLGVRLGLSAAVRASILDDVGFTVRPGKFIAIIGASGAGKSTLLTALCGRRPIVAGTVLVNGEDLHRNFEALKRDVAYVPQRDILHDLLPVREALRFTAQLRMPPDTSPIEMDHRIEQLLRSLKLHGHAHVPIRRLSGGQRKRVMLANEILAEPSIIFLDEVTSGLDEQTDREMMQLFRQLARAGKTVLCVTHTLANVADNCDQLIVLARGGMLAFYGTPDDALAYFHVPRLGDIYERLGEKPPEAWKLQFHERPEAREMGVPEFGADVPPPLDGAKLTSPFNPLEVWRQFRILLQRNGRFQTLDQQTIGLLIAQCVVVALLLIIVFGNLSELAAAERGVRANSLLFLLAIASLWFGCSNAAKEIIKDREIYKQERANSLSPEAFYFSKFSLLGGITLAQVAFLYAAVAILCRLPGSALEQFLVVGLLALVGVGMGLAISSLTMFLGWTEEAAISAVPLVLLPQVILAGVICPLQGWATPLAKTFVTAYWGIQGLGQTLPADLGGGGSMTSSVFVLMLHLVFVVIVAIMGIRTNRWRDS